jgi:DNA-binding transcriptional LysR family regulator
MERAANALRAEVSAETARVRFAVLTGCVTLFSPHMERLRRSHPEISLEFVSSTRRIDLHQNEADLAMRVGPIRDDRLMARKVADAGWSLYASPEYLERKGAPPNPRDLAGHDLVGFGDNLAWLAGAKWIVEHGKGATIAIQAQEPADLVAAAASGVGLAVLPCVVANTDPRLKRLTPEVLGRTPLSLVYRREALLAKPVQIVVRFVVDVIRAESKTILG